jgi:hypothetical protein
MAAANAIDYTRVPGPEDKLAAEVLSGDSAWRVGGKALIRPVVPLTPAETTEVSTLQKFLSTAPYKGIMTDLAASRHICSQERFVMAMCAKDQPKHLAERNCAQQGFRLEKCMMKL